MATTINRIEWVLETTDKATRPMLAADRKLRSALSAQERALKGSGATATATAAKVQRAAIVHQRAFAKTATVAQHSAKTTEDAHRRIGSSFATMAKRALAAGAGFAAAYTSIAQARKAIASTETLAKTTLGLHKSFGLTIQEASRFGGVLQARGVDARQTQMAFTTLARQIGAAGTGTKSAVKAFDDLGVSQKELKSDGDDYEKTLFRIADALKSHQGEAKAAAAAQRLFGRGAQTVVPFLRQGSAAVREQLALADRYGVTLTTKTIKPLMQLVQSQRELKLATLGLQVQFTQAFAPAILKVEGAATRLFAVFNQDIPLGDKLKKAHDIIQPLLDAFSQATPQIARTLSAVITQAVPVVAANAGKLGIAIAKGLAQGFVNADPLGQAVIAGILLKKLGVFALLGRQAGGIFSKAFATSAAPGVAASAAAGGAGGAATSGGRLARAAPVVAGAAAAAAGPVAIGAVIGLIGRQIAHSIRDALPKGTLTDIFSNAIKGIPDMIGDIAKGVKFLFDGKVRASADNTAASVRKLGRQVDREIFQSSAAGRSLALLSGRAHEAGNTVRTFGNILGIPKGPLRDLAKAAENPIDPFSRLVGEMGKFADATSQATQALSDVTGIPPLSPTIPKKRRGGRFAGGGMVPSLMSGGEMYLDPQTVRSMQGAYPGAIETIASSQAPHFAGGGMIVPGDPRRDSTMVMAEPGGFVLTGDGQNMLANMTRYAKGGFAGKYESTAYGPPWGGIEGQGSTKTGIDLHKSPHKLIVAVDPSVIPLHSHLYARPNPFGTKLPFAAEDIGGAIKGNRLDFYDWRGRESQNKWGRRNVNVTPTSGKGVSTTDGKKPSPGSRTVTDPGHTTSALSALDASTAARFLPYWRQGTVADAYAQGISLGMSGRSLVNPDGTVSEALQSLIQGQRVPTERTPDRTTKVAGAPSKSTPSGTKGGLSPSHLENASPRGIIEQLVLPVGRRFGASAAGGGPLTPKNVAAANASHGHTVSGRTSDHEGPPNRAWAVDQDDHGRRLTKHLAQIANTEGAQWGFPFHAFKSGKTYGVGQGLQTIHKPGYQVQMIYGGNYSGAGDHTNHVHFGIHRARRGGFVAGGKVGPPGIKDSKVDATTPGRRAQIQHDRDAAMAMMIPIWAAAKGYYPTGGTSPLAQTRFTGYLPFLGVGITRKHPEPPGYRESVMPDWASHDLAGPPGEKRNRILQSLIHEWAHQYQLLSVLSGPDWLSEGAATGFATRVSPQVYGGMGLGYKNPAHPRSSGYTQAAQKVRRLYGTNWIMHGQFDPSVGFPPSVAKGVAKKRRRGGFVGGMRRGGFVGGMRRFQGGGRVMRGDPGAGPGRGGSPAPGSWGSFYLFARHRHYPNRPTANQWDNMLIRYAQTIHWSVRRVGLHALKGKWWQGWTGQPGVPTRHTPGPAAGAPEQFRRGGFLGGMRSFQGGGAVKPPTKGPIADVLTVAAGIAGTATTKHQADIADAMQTLAEMVAGLPIEMVRQTIGFVQEQIRQLAVGGVTKKEHAEILRLSNIISLLTETAGTKVGQIFQYVADAIQSIDRAGAAHERLAAIAGLDPTSVAGLIDRQTQDLTKGGMLQNLVAPLQTALADAQKQGDPDAIKTATENLQSLQDAIDDNFVDYVTALRETAAAKLQEYTDSVQNVIDVGQARFELGQAQARVAGGPGYAGSPADLRAQAARQTSVAPQLATLASAFGASSWQKALSGDITGARADELQMIQNQTAAANALADAADLLKQAAEAEIQAAIDAASYQGSVAEAQGSRAQAAARLAGGAGYAGSPAALMAQAQTARDQAATQQALAQAYSDAAQGYLHVGDVAASHDAYINMINAAAAADNALADAADAMREAATAAAQALVSAASFGGDLAQVMYSRLQLQEQLTGSFDTSGAARAAFIQTVIEPAIQAEIAALSNAATTAVQQYGEDSQQAREARLAYETKQNDLLQAQLDAENAIKENTDVLKNLTGPIGFQFQGQTETARFVSALSGA